MQPPNRSLSSRLSTDESGASTVEWVLLAILAMTVLVGLVAFVAWGIDKIQESKAANDDANYDEYKRGFTDLSAHGG